MYISPFWCGVGATVAAEIALLAILVIIATLKKQR